MWFVRTIDLVREPLIYLTTVFFLLSFFANATRRWISVGLFALVIAINLWRMWPYLAVAGEELALSDAVQSNRCFTALSVNVKVTNTGYDQIARQIESVDPDVLFLMETDQSWVDALQPALAKYAHLQAHPQPHGFGMVFATRLPVTKLQIVENTHRDTPTLYATLSPAGTPPVEFIGLHPKPPLPGWNTELRDENIVNAGLQTPDRLPEAIVMGDFNDVPWSRTTTKFRQMGDWRDPRIGRGAYPTFPANMLLLGWPLDQLMLKGNLDLSGFEVMGNNGSDHRAMFGNFCLPGQ
jgi:endonuclease/exonuclease/phosphatase (EEP) superfamily protein YafD